MSVDSVSATRFATELFACEHFSPDFSGVVLATIERKCVRVCVGLLLLIGLSAGRELAGRRASASKTLRCDLQRGDDDSARVRRRRGRCRYRRRRPAPESSAPRCRKMRATVRRNSQVRLFRSLSRAHNTHLRMDRICGPSTSSSVGVTEHAGKQLHRLLQLRLQIKMCYLLRVLQMRLVLDHSYCSLLLFNKHDCQLLTDRYDSQSATCCACAMRVRTARYDSTGNLYHFRTTPAILFNCLI